MYHAGWRQGFQEDEAQSWGHPGEILLDSVSCELHRIHWNTEQLCPAQSPIHPPEPSSSYSSILTDICLYQSMTFTTDKLRWLVRKWQSLIEAVVEVKTTDGFGLRLFCIGFTKKDPEQLRKTCYAQSSQIRAIRKKMVEVIMHEASTCDLKQLVDKFIPESIGVLIEKACRGKYKTKGF